MPKNLVLFSDGTGNSAGKLFKTNVWRVYQAVDLSDSPPDASPRQFAFYDDGVGTSTFRPLAVLGGAFGLGLSRNVRDLYVFLCRMYEPGDRIYAFGFSRGAFTIRVLIGLVMAQGLVRYNGNEADLQRWAADAYRAYRAKRFKSRNPLVGLVRGLRDAVLRGWNGLHRRQPYHLAPHVGGPAQERPPGRPADDVPLTIQFVGLWDTVDAYGLPVDELTRAIDSFVWPLTMRDYNLDERVLRARHALALDDERNAFHPRLWNETPQPGQPLSGVPGANRETTHIDQERITQVWFAGVHANVGGGYANDSLSYVPLEWIMREAARYGLRFESPIWAEQRALADENGALIDSRAGLAGYYRYNPRRIERLTHTPDVQVPRTKVHESVLRRIRAGHDGYAPIALPPGFAVVRASGEIVAADAYLHGLTARAPDEAPPLLIGPDSPYAEQRERVYNAVWARRVLYFLTLAITGLLVLLPLLQPGTGACGDGGWCVPAVPLRALSVLLPSFVSVWLESFFSHPLTAFTLVAMLLISTKAGAWFAVCIRDQMRRVWYAMPALRPAAARQVPPPVTTGALARTLQEMRNHRLYLRSLRFLTHGLLPLFFFGALAYGAVATYLQLHFAVDLATGDICNEARLRPAMMAVPGEGGERLVALQPAAGETTPGLASPSGASALMRVSALCALARAEPVAAGATYRIRLTIPGHARWWADSIPAGPHGLEGRVEPKWAFLMAAAVPLRRHLAEPWFQPMARIGGNGNDTYVLQQQPSTPRRNDRRTRPDESCASRQAAHPAPEEIFEATLVARSSGPLFLYVNDAIGMPWHWQAFYENNCGSAWIEVEQLRATPGAAAS